jgi:hypothetical protein
MWCIGTTWGGGVALEMDQKGGAHSPIPKISLKLFQLLKNNIAYLFKDVVDCVMVNCGRTMASTVFSLFKESSTLFI